MAHEIRSRDKLITGEPKQIFVKVDGFNYQNRQLKVTHPDIPNLFFTAQVRDPVFEIRPNIYTDAAANSQSLLITVEETRRMEDNQLMHMCIYEAILH